MSANTAPALSEYYAFQSEKGFSVFQGELLKQSALGNLEGVKELVKNGSSINAETAMSVGIASLIHILAFRRSVELEKGFALCFSERPLGRLRVSHREQREPECARQGQYVCEQRRLVQTRADKEIEENRRRLAACSVRFRQIGRKRDREMHKRGWEQTQRETNGSHETRGLERHRDTRKDTDQSKRKVVKEKERKGSEPRDAAGSRYAVILSRLCSRMTVRLCIWPAVRVMKPLSTFSALLKQTYIA